jgi:hypothetical protein
MMDTINHVIDTIMQSKRFHAEAELLYAKGCILVRK